MGHLLIDFSTYFKSEKQSIKLVEPLINDLRERINLSYEIFYNILIAVTEAVNNAIVHGNKLSLNKPVRLEVKADSNEIHITVSDQGDGFEPDKLSDPRHPDNLLKESGRGVFLIRALSDYAEITSNSAGTTVQMTFKVKNQS